MRRRLLFLTVWLLGVAGLWRGLPPAPVAAFEADGMTRVAEGGIAVLVGRPPPDPPDPGRHPLALPPMPLPTALHGRGPVEGRDIRSGRLLWTAHGPEVGAEAGLTADGRRVLLGVGELKGWRPVTAEVREAATGELVGRYPGDAEFSPPDARYALVRRPAPAGQDGSTLDLYETATGRWVRRLPDGPFPAFSGDGRRLLVPHSRYRGGRVYDTATGRLLARFAEPRQPEWFGTDGRRLIDADGVVWDVDAHAAVGRVDAVAAGHSLGPDDGWVSPDGRWAATRLDGTDPAGRPEAVWTLLPGGDRRHRPADGYRVSSLSSEAGGRLVSVHAVRDRPAGAVGRWLARRHPMFRELGFDRTDRRHRLLDPRTAGVVADLPENTHFERLSADGRTLYTWDYREKRGPLVKAWDLPMRPSPWLVAALAAGWAVALWLVARRLGRARRV